MYQSSGGVAERYARAILEIAIAHDDAEGWLRDLRTIEVVLGSPDLQGLLHNPEVTTDRKIELVSLPLQGVGQLQRNFAAVLIAKGRSSAVSSIVAQFQQLLDEYRGRATAEVTTATPLASEQAQDVVRWLEGLTGRRVSVQWQTDPDIVGGLVARVGDQLIDASVAGRLAALREQLLT